MVTAPSGSGSGSLDSSTHGRIMDASAHGGSANNAPAEGLGKPRVLKFEVQLYKMREGEYTVDVQVGRRHRGFGFTASGM